jgi:acetate kinase
MRGDHAGASRDSADHIRGGVWSARDCVVTVKSGLSNLKIAIFAAADLDRRIDSGRVERIGRTGSWLVASDAHGRRVEESDVAAPDHAAAAVLSSLDRSPSNDSRVNRTDEEVMIAREVGRVTQRST